MPEVMIQDSTFERLQRHAKPLVDTIDTVVNRALDALEQVVGEPAPGRGRGTEAERRIDPRMLPRLTHTKVLDASVDGQPIAKPNWNLLLDDMLRRAMKRVGTFEKLQQLCPVNMIKGRKEDEGFQLSAGDRYLGSGPGFQRSLPRGGDGGPGARHRARYRLYVAAQGSRGPSR